MTTSLYDEILQKIPLQHPQQSTAQITLTTIQKQIVKPTPTSLYLSLLSLFSQQNPPSCTQLLIQLVLPMVPRPIFHETQKNLFTCAKKMGSESLSLIGQMLIQGKDLLGLEFVMDQINTSQRKKAIDILVHLLQRKDLNKQISIHISQQIQQSEGKAQVSWSMILNRGLKLMSLENVCEIIIWMKNIQDNDILVHVLLGIENLLRERELSESVVENILSDLIQHGVDVYGEERLAFAYGQALVQALVKFQELNPYRVRKYVSPVMSVCCDLLQSDNEKYLLFSRGLFSRILENCVNRQFWSDYQDQNDFAVILDQMQLEDTKIPPFEKTVIQMQFLLSSRFQFQLKQSLEILCDYFSQLESEVFEKVEGLIVEFLNLRTQPKTPKSLFQKCFSILIQKMNPQKILKLVPIDINFDVTDPKFEDNSNLWILPYFSKHLRSTPLSFFIQSYLFNLRLVPLLEYFSKPMNSLTMQHLFQHLSGIIWDLLPYCHILNIDPINFLVQLQSVPQSYPILKFYEQVALYSITKNLYTQSLQKYSEKIIPLIVKNLDNNHAQGLKTIRAWSLRSSQDYLIRVVKKNLEKLLLSQGNWHLNCEVLIEVLSGIKIDTDLWSNIQQLIKQCFMKSEDKFAYKLILKCASKLHFSYMKEIQQILNSQTELKVGIKPIRLQIISRMYANNNSQVVLDFLPEIIASLRQTNKKTRKLGRSILLQISEKEGVQNVISLVMAGFGGSSSLIKADSLAAITLLIKQVDQAFMNEVLQIALLLFNEKNKEIYRTLLKLLKQYIKITEKNSLKENLKQILVGMLSIDSRSKDQNITLVKHFIEKCIRKVGKDFLIIQTPIEHQKLIKYTDKNIKLLKRKRQLEKKRRLLHKKKHDIDEKVQEERLQEDQTQNLLLKFDTDKEAFHFQEQRKEKKIQKTQQDDVFQDITFVEGRMIVREQTEEVGKKRKREELKEEDLFEITKQAPERKVKRICNQFIKVQDVHMVKESGSTYKAKNATGDNKIHGRPDPYAFIQLNPKALNRRFTKRSEKSFNSISSGPLKGLKKKVKN